MLARPARRRGSSTPSGDGERVPRRRAERRLVANAERYYRVMYYGRGESWNLRDRHMFETLQACSRSTGPDVEGGRVGAQLPPRRRLRHRDGRARRAQRGPAVPARVRRRRVPGRLRHRPRHGRRGARLGWADAASRPCAPPTPRATSGSVTTPGVPAFLLHLREPTRARGARGARPCRGSSAPSASSTGRRPSSRATTSRPSLPHQFDEYVWFDETSAVTPLAAHHLTGVPDTYPFGL